MTLVGRAWTLATMIRTLAILISIIHPTCLVLPNRMRVRQVSASTTSFRRILTSKSQVLISTGKSDWAKEVTEAPGTLAAYLNDAHSKLLSSSSSSNTQFQPEQPNGSSASKSVPGVFRTAESTRLAIINSSHRTISHESNETCISLPDFVVWTEVPPTPLGAEDLWRAGLDPGSTRGGFAPQGSSLKSYPLPFQCVILLCSHKRRDNRCHIAAPKLEEAFCHSLESHGWETHTQLLDEECLGDPLPEDHAGSGLRAKALTDRLHELEQEELKKALILKISHIGGHKYAGEFSMFIEACFWQELIYLLVSGNAIVSYSLPNFLITYTMIRYISRKVMGRVFGTEGSPLTK